MSVTLLRLPVADLLAGLRPWIAWHEGADRLTRCQVAIRVGGLGCVCLGGLAPSTPVVLRARGLAPCGLCTAPVGVGGDGTGKSVSPVRAYGSLG